MRTRQTYSEEFKRSLIAKVMSRGNRTIGEVCRQEGVLSSTAGNWMKEYGKVPGMTKPASQKKWSAEDKLTALITTSAMSGEELGSWLRREGLHSPRLTEWRADCIKSLGTVAGHASALKRDVRDERIKELEHDLARMEKALAEASARMMLQKKADLFWASREERLKK